MRKRADISANTDRKKRQSTDDSESYSHTLTITILVAVMEESGGLTEYCCVVTCVRGVTVS